MPEQERATLYMDLTRLMAKSGMFGFGMGIDLQECKSTFPGVSESMPDMPFFDCFLKTVTTLVMRARLFIPQEKVEFTFDQQKETNYNAGLLYDWIVSHREVQYYDLMAEKMSFATRREVGIQAADLWAREVLKRCDSCLFDDRTAPRPQWTLLHSTNRFRARFMSKEYFEGLRNQMDELVMPGLTHEEYEVWRKRKRLVDNLSNRFRYMSLLHNRELSEHAL